MATPKAVQKGIVLGAGSGIEDFAVVPLKESELASGKIGGGRVISPEEFRKQASQVVLSDKFRVGADAPFAGTVGELRQGETLLDFVTRVGGRQNAPEPLRDAFNLLQGGQVASGMFQTGDVLQTQEAAFRTPEQIANDEAVLAQRQKEIARDQQLRTAQAEAGTQPLTQDRLLGPREFEALRKELGVAEHNFDTFFRRDDQGNIFLKGDAPEVATPAPGERLLGPSEFNKLREQFGATPDSFNRFFRRDAAGRIFLKPDAFEQQRFDAGELEREGADMLGFGQEGILDMIESGGTGLTSTDPDAFVGSIDSVLQRLEADISADIQTIESGIEQLGTRAERAVELDEQFGVSDKVKQLQDLNVTIAQKINEYKLQEFQIEGQPIPQNIINGQVQGLKKLQAIEIGNLATMATALQGNVELAQRLADRTLAMEFDTLEQQLNLTAQVMGMKQDQLSREESRLWKRIELANQERQRVLDEKRQDKKQLQDLVINLASQGVDVSGIDMSKGLDANLEKITGRLSTAASLSKGQSRDLLSTALELFETGSFSNLSEAFRAAQNLKQGDVDPFLSIQIENAGVDEIAQAIRKIESGGNYEARGASGEFGAYQFMPGTWEQWQREFQESRGMTGKLNPSPENQDAVAKFKIRQWLSEGLSPQQIASKWNSGSTEWQGKVGVNQFGVPFDVPGYVKKFSGALAQIRQTSEPPRIDLSDIKQNQFEAGTFAVRALTADGIVDQLGDFISGLGAVGFEIQKRLPNFAKRSEIQQLEQAQRNFINAILRRESGAAISDAEFENAEQQYFPVPGDGAAVLEQKRQNRQQVINGLKNEAGKAFDVLNQNPVNDPLGIQGAPGSDPLGLFE